MKGANHSVVVQEPDPDDAEGYVIKTLRLEARQVGNAIETTQDQIELDESRLDKNRRYLKRLIDAREQIQAAIDVLAVL